MPVKKNTKKVVSKQDRKEIRDAVGSIPGLIIEHVSFDKNNSLGEDIVNDDNEKITHNKRFMLSDEKRREQQKKKNTMFIGVGVVLLVLALLWVINIKSFFFDSKHSISNEETLLGTIKNDFDNTIGKLEKQNPTTSSPSPTKIILEKDLQSALLAGLASVSSTSSTLSTSSSTKDFPTAKTVTSTNTNSTP
jgi:cytoskeletal protein RodZ